MRVSNAHLTKVTIRFSAASQAEKLDEISAFTVMMHKCDTNERHRLQTLQ
jgi:hypothetical protein